MNVKIDTKEKFSVITPVDKLLTANMTEELSNLLHQHLTSSNPHLVINMFNVEEADEELLIKLAGLQQHFYEQHISFVFCELKETVSAKLDELELLETMNVTPTESEAWDIVQMEEIERELLNDFDEETDQDA